MKNLKLVTAIIMSLVGYISVLISAVDACVFHFSHIDMTALRTLVEHPRPVIVFVISFILIRGGQWLLMKD